MVISGAQKAMIEIPEATPAEVAAAEAAEGKMDKTLQLLEQQVRLDWCLVRLSCNLDKRHAVTAVARSFFTCASCLLCTAKLIIRNVNSDQLPQCFLHCSSLCGQKTTQRGSE